MHDYMFKGDLEKSDDLDAFGDKMRGSWKLTIELVRGRQSESTSDRCTLCAIDRQRSAQNPDGLKPKSRHIYKKYPWPTFNLIFMCSGIVLGNTRSLLFPTFLVLHSKKVLVDLERRSKTRSELCIGTPLIS